MKTLLCTLLCICLYTIPVAAQRGDNDPDRAVTGNGRFPAGWNVRPDRGAADQLQFSQTGDVYHFTMGSAGTFYKQRLDEIRRLPVFRPAYPEGGAVASDFLWTDDWREQSGR
jgi:hypothetical protein